MTDTSQIRLWNLRQLVAAAGGINEAARRIGRKNSYLTAIAGPNPIRSIGDKVAAAIEQGFGLPPGALDTPPPAELEAVKADSVLTQIISALSFADERDKEIVLALARALVSRPAIK